MCSSTVEYYYYGFLEVCPSSTPGPTQGPKKVSSLHRGATGVKGSSSEIVLPDAEPSSSLQPSPWFDISSLSEPKPLLLLFRSLLSMKFTANHQLQGGIKNSNGGDGGGSNG